MRACLLGRRIVFVGDSTIQQLYWAALRRLDPSIGRKAHEDYVTLEDQYVDLSKTIDGVRVDFVWDPWLNATDRLGQLAYFRHQPDTPESEALARMEDKHSPAIIVLGSPSLWPVLKEEEEYLQLFGDGINTVLPWLRVSIDEMTMLPKRQVTAMARPASSMPSDEISNSVFLIPVLSPNWESLSYAMKLIMNPEKISRMNWNLRNSDAIDQSYIPWGFEAMTAGFEDAYLEDGIHVSQLVVDQRLTNLLNARCNAGLPIHGASSQATCCTPYPDPSKMQRLLLSMAVMGLPWLALKPESLPPRMMRGIIAMSSLLVVSASCYLTDRTHLFSKQQKDFSLERLLLSVSAIYSLFIFSLCHDTTKTTEKHTSRPENFLSRTQSDEWRGWMQAFALLYSFHGASHSSAWYKVFRLCTSIFIFLFSYGHTSFFLQTRDYSLRRVVHVLVRLNLLSIILVYTMNRPWTLYYFCPLASFWFLVAYLTLSTMEQVNTSLSGVLSKIAVAAVATTFIIDTRGVLGGVLLALEKGLGIVWDLETVQYNLAMDQLVPYFGMATAAIAHRVATGKSTADGSIVSGADATLDLMIQSVLEPEEDSIPVKTMTYIFSATILSLLFLIAFMSSGSNAAYDAYHPFTGPWFALAAIILRNCHKTLRETHSVGAIALGRISLETSLLHHHIWLAGDGTTILRIASARFLALPRLGPLLENSQTTILLIILLWSSIKCRSATRQITDLLATEAEEKGKGTEFASCV
ncbi:Cas1p-like protein [Plectosphaerella cucumerina]|uniref:Cas1p-like protein n=1 Tax=Plectosphaerella cucumerina TaxID=40658 RepID=A0A8K0TCB5_9PEZI|nr:Cas1p-like protein [Plectosphaerella cucumerina]